MRREARLTPVMDKVADLLASTLIPALGEAVKAAPAWKAAVGEKIAKLTLPVKLAGGVLTVHVRDNIWMQELKYFTPEILQKLHEAGLQITEIQYIYKPGPMQKPDVPKKKRKVGDEEMRFVDNFSRNITDPELKESYRKALTAYFERHSLDEFFRG